MSSTMRIGLAGCLIQLACLAYPFAAAAQNASPTQGPGYYYPQQPFHYGGYAPYAYPAPGPATRVTPTQGAAAAPTLAETAAPARLPNGTPTAFSLAESRLGPVLTNDQGLTLYRSDLDAEGVAACMDDCGSLWRPFLMTDSDQSAPPFEAMQRPDGSRQWTHAGHPLYLWFGDAQTGDVTGDGLDGLWHAVRISTLDLDREATP